MADVKWIKITTDIFDDEKILLIESMPDAYSIIVVWFKLLCLAGKQNNSGVFMMNNQIAYTDKMLATIFRMKESTVQLALQTFERFGMVEIIDGVITIPNWGKHQSLEQIEARKEYQKLYQREYRKKQKLLTDQSEESQRKHLREQNVNTPEVDIEEDKEEGEVKATTASADTVCSTDVQRIIDNWNTLGLSRITAVKPNTKRSKTLKARIREYGVDTIMQAIEKVRASSYLKGGSKSGWTITFDWFILPNNFPKVLDGNYDNRQPVQQTYQRSAGSPMANIRREDYEKDEDVPW